MNNSRRDFLKKASLLSSVAITLPSLQNDVFAAKRFNMSGYAAPKIDKVKVAVI